MKQQINIFVISPNDVKEERQITKEVCEELNGLVGRRIEINAVLWEYHPMSYHKNAQENIDDTLDKCDIFVIILWRRLGSVVEGFEGAVTKSQKVTGTQYEIEKILSLKKEHIYFYFKREEKHFLEHELEEAVQQKKLLDTFLKNINLAKGSTKHGYQEFEERSEFREKLTIHLKNEIQRLSGRKITISKRYKKKQPITKFRKYVYILLYLLGSSIIFSLYIGYYFLPSISVKLENIIKKENILTVKINQDKNSSGKKQNIIIKKKEHKLSNHNSFIEYVKIKKYLSLDNKKMRENSINPYYLYYKTIHPHSFNFAMSQWIDLSIVSLEFSEQLTLEKDEYGEYIDKELKNAKEHLNQISILRGANLKNLFYAYANSEDMFANLTIKQMRKKLKKYVVSSLNNIKLASHLLKALKIYEKTALRVGISNLNTHDIVFKNSATLIYKEKKYFLEHIQEPLNLATATQKNTDYQEEFIIIPKGSIVPLWFSIDTLDNFCEDTEKYVLELLTKDDEYVRKEIQCK